MNSITSKSKVLRYCARSKTARSICLSSLFFICQLSHASPYNIHGIKGDLKDNVNARLKLIKKTTSLSNTELTLNIEKAMAPFGYYAPLIQIKNQNISINKGKATHINTVKITLLGPGRPLIQRLFKNDKLIKGQVFNSEAYTLTKQTLFNLAEKNGYLNARMIDSKAAVNKMKRQANITLTFSTGNLYYFGDIKFKNTTAYNPLFLKRYLNFKKNEPFNTDKLLTLTAHLNDSVYFNKVVVKPKIDKKIQVPIDIYLHDKPAQNYLAGMGYVTDTGIRARLGSQWLRVNEWGHTFQALYVGSQKQNALQAEYIIPGRDPTIDQYAFSSKIFQLRYPIGNAHAQQFSAASIFHKNKRLFTLSLNRLEETFNFIGYNKKAKKMLYPNLKVDYKKIISPLFSKKGIALTANLKYANQMILSDLNLLQIELTAKIAFWLPTHTRLFFRNQLGLTHTNDINELPLSLQLLAGGADSIRGYHYQSIGLGKRIQVHSAEIQQETFKNWYLTAFYDLGSVYNPLVKQWKRGIGGGLMWISPIGPIRLSLAKALDDKDKQVRIIFNMGPDL